MTTKSSAQSSVTNQAIEIAIRLGLLILVFAWCFQILSPFISLVLWGGIIAIAIHSPVQKFAARLGNRKKLAVSLIAALGILVILLPVFSLSKSLVAGATALGTDIKNGTLNIPPPKTSVQEWPVVGEKVYAFWLQISGNLEATLSNYSEQLSTVGIKLLEVAAGAGLGLLQFIISLIIAAVFLLNAEVAVSGLQKLAGRLLGERGNELLDMSAATIRSVAVGVIGIAFIQALLGGIGMMAVGVPAAGLLAIVILVLAIAQLPPILVLGPVAIWVFSIESTTVSMVFLVWSIVVSWMDMILKPLLLGRGVSVPMVIVLLGAIGGMLTSGIVGLFIGAVVLALGYTLFQAWIDWEQATESLIEEEDG
jgi:predicted PurR-regulated permease PerM